MFMERKETYYTNSTPAHSHHAYASASELGGLTGHMGRWQVQVDCVPGGQTHNHAGMEPQFTSGPARRGCSGLALPLSHVWLAESKAWISFLGWVE